MLLVRHIDEVDNDDPAQVAQAQLPGQRGGSLEVGPEYGLIHIASTQERAGVHIDHGHRFSLVDDQVAATVQVHPMAEGALQFLLSPEPVKE